LRILISGASGFVGGALFRFLASRGHDPVALGRSKKGENSIIWNPEEGTAVLGDFEGFDAVVHLAGEPLTLARWSRSKKEKILYSRTVGTFFLSQLLSQLLQPPKVFVSASAIGFYGDRGEEVLTEESGAGSGFLASVCCEWEKAARSLANRGVRTVQTRFGMVLGPDGGALAKMLLPFKLGLGGRLGPGNQWVSWIDREDLIRAIDFILVQESMEGPVNLVSPHAVRQKEFAETLAALLHRPAKLPLPAWLLHVLYGESADEMILSSCRAAPGKLMKARFPFLLPNIKDSLQKAIR
jgi:uncharacterized protein (TIGR01777 family)